MHFSKQTLESPHKLKSLLQGLGLHLWAPKDTLLYQRCQINLTPKASSVQLEYKANLVPTRLEQHQPTPSRHQSAPSVRAQSKTTIPVIDFLVARISGLIWVFQGSEWRLLEPFLAAVALSTANSDDLKKMPFHWPLSPSSLNLSIDQSETVALEALGAVIQQLRQPQDRFVILDQEVLGWLQKIDINSTDMIQFKSLDALFNVAAEKHRLWLELARSQ